MKFEEKRARESTREYYRKRGIIIHRSLEKYKLNGETNFKHIYYTSLEGEGT